MVKLVLVSKEHDPPVWVNPEKVLYVDEIHNENSPYSATAIYLGPGERVLTGEPIESVVQKLQGREI